MDLYAPQDHRQKFMACIILSKVLAGNTLSKQLIKELKKQEKDKFNLFIEDGKIQIIRNGEKEELLHSFLKILELGAFHLEEYAVITNVLLQLKGFSVCICLKIFSEYKRAYSIVEVAEKEYYTLDVLGIEDKLRSNELPVENNPLLSDFSLQKQTPLSKNYWNDDLFQQLQKKCKNNHKLSAKLGFIQLTWK